MKRILIIAVIMCATFAIGASLTIPSTTYFQSDVYLSDNPSASLKSRIPTGDVASVIGGVFDPLGDVTFRGALRVETNKSQTFIYKPAVSTVQTGVVINANGTIDLQKWVDGTGNYTYTLDPRRPPVTTTNGIAYAQGALFAGDVSLTNNAAIYTSTNGIYGWNVDGTRDHVLYYDEDYEHTVLNNIGYLSVAGGTRIYGGVIRFEDSKAISVEERTLIDNNGEGVLTWVTGNGGVVLRTNIVMQNHAITNAIYYGDGAGITNITNYVSKAGDTINGELIINYGETLSIGKDALPGAVLRFNKGQGGMGGWNTITSKVNDIYSSGGIYAPRFYGNGAGLTNIQHVAEGSRLAAFIIAPGSTNTIVTAGAYQPLDGTWSNRCVHDFTYSASNIIYTGSTKKAFEIDWQASVSGDSLNVKAFVAVAINDTLCPMSIQQSETKDANVVSSFGGTCVLDLASNDVVQIQTTSDGTGDELYFVTFSTTIREFN